MRWGSGKPNYVAWSTKLKLCVYCTNSRRKSLATLAEESGVVVLNENMLEMAKILHPSCVLNSIIEASAFIKNGDFAWSIALLRSIKTQQRECKCRYCVASAHFDVGPIELCIYERQFMEMLHKGTQEAQALLHDCIQHLAAPKR